MARSSVNPNVDGAVFSRTAAKTRSINLVRPITMRGGIRL